MARPKASIPRMVLQKSSPDLFSVLDSPAAGSRIARFLSVPETSRLLSCSWMLYKGVIGRTAGLMHHAFLEGGYDDRDRTNCTRLAAWLYACRSLKSAPRRGTLVNYAAGFVDDGTGIGGEIDRDICRTFPERPSFHIGEAELGAGGLGSKHTWEFLGPSSGLVKLRNVLHLFSDARPEIGYCQVSCDTCGLSCERQGFMAATATRFPGYELRRCDTIRNVRCPHTQVVQ
jgi:hypothetical protein